MLLGEEIVASAELGGAASAGELLRRLGIDGLRAAGGRERRQS